ncbi:uncharacterized protein LOC111795494 isoform X1 [Cucurbita pepo subsp. pepo]|uniref:uncharacterized protein LOC111795494 isoform X1 n=1 Tax=Cucurbita pepo subsp. pepo TaxID=3664 RepID=UPI000C9D4F09|nr:uncharacterized protein LOC111795494 isoform X1 [Cucurbita pepo subsp. pepo]
MADNLFEGLPPPISATDPSSETQPQDANTTQNRPSDPSPNPPASSSSCPPPVIKSALKRPKTALEPNPTAPAPAPAPGKRLRFKTTTDASETQVMEAMQKIASHIKNPTKFGKAAKLAIQLIQAGSVKAATSDHFFAILEAAMSMSSSTPCTDPSVRGDYHALFSAAQSTMECLNKKQKNQLSTWTIRAVVANDLLTDDSFVFSKTATQIKEAISNLPVATKEDDVEEAEALKVHEENTDDEHQKKENAAPAEKKSQEESDPFGLEAFLPGSLKKGERTKGKNDVESKIRKDEEVEAKSFLKAQREALISCLEIAAHRYKIPWCQTVIDILVKHAFDNVMRFTSQQRDAIGKLWASVREQQNRRKQGKSVSGKLDVNGFEWLQQKYANEKISIRHSVGASGDRKAQQWLG